MTDQYCSRRTLLGVVSAGVVSVFAGCTDLYREIGASSDTGGSGGQHSGDDGSSGGGQSSGGGGSGDGDSDSGGSSGGGEKPTPTSTPADSTTPADVTTPEDATATDTATDMPSSTQSDGPSVPDESWEAPEPINNPDPKYDDRIDDVEFINTVENGDGYADFDIRVHGNTVMEDVDPSPDEPGEPTFAVKLDGVLVARTRELDDIPDVTYNIDIPTGALKQFESGQLAVTVLLFDPDKKSDDLYGRWEGTVMYRP
ncbi:hypothetical protein [Halocatena halophila]|uniref:hypothetical protein n=1 Tax=Halocatena halophila TaxID=2814576 RepID=UPI002ED3686B